MIVNYGALRLRLNVNNVLQPRIITVPFPFVSSGRVSGAMAHRYERSGYAVPVRAVNYPPWADTSEGAGAAPSRAAFSGQSLPANFHDYHWRRSNGRSQSSRSRSNSPRSSMSVTRVARNPFSDNTLQTLNEVPFLPFSSSTTAITRNWEYTGLGSLLKSNKSPFGASGTSDFHFSLMSYNILGPDLLRKHSELYTKCKQEDLDWDNRVFVIFEEIAAYNPDIICLQEVEDAQFQITFEPRFYSLGYRGVFKKKTGDKDDGCAIFYKTSKFLLIDELSVEFRQPHVPLLDRDNVALLVKLETRNVNKRQKIIVGNTHLLFNPRRHDVKTAQAQLLLAELDRFSFCGFDKQGQTLYHPILMTGDFNVTPYSSVSKLFTEGELQYLDEHGDLVKLLKRKGFDSLLPAECGITDQCQHYKIIWERYKRWKNGRVGRFFELDLRTQEALVNIFPYMMMDGVTLVASNRFLLTPSDEILSLLSPVTEGVEDISSVASSTNNTKLLARAAKKIELQKSTEDRDCGLDARALQELKKSGTFCEFGSGKLTHNLRFRDIYASKLDRTDPDAGVSTMQNGWTCVDYIYQSMTWNSSFKKAVEGKLKLVRRLGLLSRSQCKQIGSFPNRDHPSDHLPLVAEFLLR